MPPQTGVSDKELKDLVAYVRTLSKENPAATAPTKKPTEKQALIDINKESSRWRYRQAVAALQIVAGQRRRGESHH